MDAEAIEEDHLSIVAGGCVEARIVMTSSEFGVSYLEDGVQIAMGDQARRPSRNRINMVRHNFRGL